MINEKYADYAWEQTAALLAIDSPSGFTRRAAEWVKDAFEALGFPVFCVDRPEQIQPAIDALLQWNPGEPIPQGIGAKIPEIHNTEMPQVALPESEVMPV